MKNLEKKLEKLIRESLYHRVRGENWTRIQKIKEGIREVFRVSDLTASELCDAFEITIEKLEYILDEDYDRRPRKDIWTENFDKRLPLFVPVKIRGI
jgi:hypothetical protein